MPEVLQEDSCEVVGEKGSIRFPVFGNRFEVINPVGTKSFDFVQPEHIQQPMIQKVVNYFLGKELNPCSAEDALKSMKVMEAFLTQIIYNK
ncbi:MAG: Gfo/Idh/MocA family oxidoreductase [Mucilaginibacter sp.]|nr:Gfo/Idh/MocA family oxidoreductase [Mucilaginibacter sp.]